ncbi:unnamed protein product, partial [Ectocarpus sp. 12 AP-2014]
RKPLKNFSTNCPSLGPPDTASFKLPRRLCMFERKGPRERERDRENESDTRPDVHRNARNFLWLRFSHMPMRSSDMPISETTG